MFSKKNLVLTSVTALGAALLVLTQTASSNSTQIANKLEGAWISKVPGTAVQFTTVFTPDASGARASIIGALQVRIPVDLMFPGLPPAVDGSYDFVGEVVMTGPDTANATLLGYAFKKVAPSAEYPFGEQVLWIWVGSGEIKFAASGRTETTGSMAIYLPEADANGDGLPDPGQTPLICFPISYPSVRPGLMPPCQPPAK